MPPIDYVTAQAAGYDGTIVGKEALLARIDQAIEVAETHFETLKQFHAEHLTQEKAQTFSDLIDSLLNENPKTKKIDLDLAQNEHYAGEIKDLYDAAQQKYIEGVEPYAIESEAVYCQFIDALGKMKENIERGQALTGCGQKLEKIYKQFDSGIADLKEPSKQFTILIRVSNNVSKKEETTIETAAEAAGIYLINNYFSAEEPLLSLSDNNAFVELKKMANAVSKAVALGKM